MGDVHIGLGYLRDLPRRWFGHRDTRVDAYPAYDKTGAGERAGAWLRTRWRPIAGCI